MEEESRVKTIPKEEAVNLLQFMRSNKFSDLDKDEFSARYGHFFNHVVMADIPPLGCTCHNMETFKLDWRPDIPSELERIVADGYCTHLRVASVSKKLGFYPIHVAAGLGNMALLCFILDQGGDMYSTTLSEGLYPFDIAIMNKHTSVSEELLFRRFRYPDVEDTLKQKDKMITMCLYFNDTNSASCCIRAGAKISADHWKRLLYQAVERSQITVINWLLGKGIGDVNDTLRNGFTALHLANTKEVAQLLLDNGANPAIVNAEEGTALMLQLKRKRLEVAECILKFAPSLIDQMVSGASDNQHNHYTALQNCAWDGYLEGIEMLCWYGADPTLPTFDGNTPVGLACHADWLSCVQYLLSLGCDTNCQDDDGDTALTYATYNGNWTIVDTLLKHGADPNTANNYDVTPLWNAVYSRSLQSVKRLLSMNVDAMRICRGRHIYEVADLNHIYDEPVSPLFVAIHHEDLSIAKALVTAGCYINHEKFSLPNFHMYVAHWAEDNKRWLEHVSSNPPSLMWWCKRVIRQQLPTKPKMAVESFDIPCTLQDYIQEI